MRTSLFVKGTTEVNVFYYLVMLMTSKMASGEMDNMLNSLL